LHFSCAGASKLLHVGFRCEVPYFGVWRFVSLSLLRLDSVVKEANIGELRWSGWLLGGLFECFRGFFLCRSWWCCECSTLCVC
jgi:hypothetical protein